MLGRRNPQVLVGDCEFDLPLTRTKHSAEGIYHCIAQPIELSDRAVEYRRGERGLPVNRILEIGQGRTFSLRPPPLSCGRLFSPANMALVE